METSNTLDRMATYDFKTPIEIVCFEENSDDEIDLTSSPKSKDVESNKVVNEIDLNRIENETIQGKNVEITKEEKKVNTKKRKTVIKNTENEKDNDNIKDKPTTIPQKILKTTNNLNTTFLNDASDNLNTISKYLTLILESQRHCLVAASNKNNTAHQLSLLNKRYWDVKQHLFNEGYERVNRYILPNENNQAFIHNFLNYTVSMAETRNKIDCNQGITEIYFEMMKWVKQKKLKDFSESCKTPILMQHLKNPPVIPTVTISESIQNVPQPCPNDGNQDKLCIFSSGPPGRHININVDKSLINHNNQAPGTNRLPQNKVMQQNLNIQQTLHNRISPNSNFSVGDINIRKNDYKKQMEYGELMRRRNNGNIIPTNGCLPIIDNRVPHYAPPPNRLTNVVHESNQISLNTNYNYYHTTNNFQNNGFYSANNFIHNGTSHVPNTIVHEDGRFQSLRRGYPPRADVRAPPPPYQSPVAVHPTQMMQPVTPAPTILPGLPSGPDLTRSTSTDSGFVSPLGSKSSTNPIEDILNDLFELENTVEQKGTAPAQAVCHVCQRHAKLMCSACFKTAYCDTKCQRIDWETHRLFCPPPAGKRRQ